MSGGDQPKQPVLETAFDVAALGDAELEALVRKSRATFIGFVACCVPILCGLVALAIDSTVGVFEYALAAVALTTVALFLGHAWGEMRVIRYEWWRRTRLHQSPGGGRTAVPQGD